MRVAGVPIEGVATPVAVEQVAGAEHARVLGKQVGLGEPTKRAAGRPEHQQERAATRERRMSAFVSTSFARGGALACIGCIGCIGMGAMGGHTAARGMPVA